MEILKVSAGSPPNMVAGAIANVMRKAGEVEVQTIGAGATNQAVKAIAIARGRATIATVKPAITSERKSLKL